MIKRILLILPLLFSILCGVSYIAADGSFIDAPSRQYHYHYHNSTNDFNFFGSNRWGVRFNFANAYPGLEDPLFRIEGARLWFPIAGDSVTVELALDNAGQPGLPISTKRAAVNQQQVDIAFDEAVEADIIWLLVNYRTNMNNRFVAASRGGGSNSYFLNQVGDVQHLSSFALAGFQSELLFGLLGDFVFDEVDLRLQSFDLSGELLPSAQVQPAFEIYNHSNIPISEAELKIMLSRPGFAHYDTLLVQIPHTLEPYELYRFGADSDFIPYINLPDEPCQLRVEATLTSEYPEIEVHFANNSKQKNYEIFIDESPLALVENFLRQDQSALINSMQIPYSSDLIHVINYYPILSDSLANLGSMRRFNWYAFNSIPRTVGNGNRRIIGFTNQYEELLQDMVQDLPGDRSFISSAHCAIFGEEDTENIHVDLDISNASTTLYTAAAQSLMMRSRLFVGLFEKQGFGDLESYGLSRWIAFADTVNQTLNMGATARKSYSFSSGGLSFDELAENYRVFYWVQALDGGRIYYADYCDFEPESTSSISDNVVPPARLQIYPNPLVMSDKLTIRYPEPARLSIYNLRGQKIYRDENFNGEKSLKSSLFPVSGIYFIRIEVTDAPVISKKISIIK